MRSLSQLCRSRRAATLVELLVAAAVIGFLLALLIPAVQQAREAARAVQCRNNLHQIGVAVHAFEQSTRQFPAGVGFSYIAHLLPYLDQRPLFDSINFNQDDAMANVTANQISVGTFICPSDETAHALGAPLCYAGNMGSSFIDDANRRGGSGVFDPHIRTSPKDIVDGLSATALASEWLTAGGLRDRKWAVLRTSPYIESVDVFALRCQGSNPHALEVASAVRGTPWLDGTPGMSLYNHILPPNRHTCLNDHALFHSAWTTSSRHGSGVFCLYADGRVDFTRSGIDTSVWRALGTRNGGEVIESYR